MRSFDLNLKIKWNKALCYLTTKNRYLQNTRKIQCFKFGIVSINGGSQIHLMFSENLSTTWRHFGHYMAYFIFVQFI